MEDLVMIDPQFWSGRRVLLTGHTGFKGSWLLLWLRSLGAQVWTFALEPEFSPNLFHDLAHELLPDEGFRHQIGDLADLDSLKALVLQAQPEVVLHSSSTLVRRSYRHPLLTWSTNVMVVARARGSSTPATFVLCCNGHNGQGL